MSLSSFNEVQKIEQEDKIALPFSLPSGQSEEAFANSLALFLASDEGKNFRFGVKKVIDQITAVIRDWEEKEHITIEKKENWINHLNDFHEKIFELYDGNYFDYNKELYPLFTDGIKILYTFSEKIQDDTIHLALRLFCVENLLNNNELNARYSGVVEFIKTAYQPFSEEKILKHFLENKLKIFSVISKMHKNDYLAYDALRCLNILDQWMEKLKEISNCFLVKNEKKLRYQIFKETYAVFLNGLNNQSEKVNLQFLEKVREKLENDFKELVKETYKRKDFFDILYGFFWKEKQSFQGELNNFFKKTANDLQGKIKTYGMTKGYSI